MKESFRIRVVYGSVLLLFGFALFFYSSAIGAENPIGYNPENPDFPFVEPERHYADVSNSAISFTKEDGNHAQFVSQQVPQSVPLRKLFNAKITFLNTGTTTWKAGEYALGSQNPPDTNLWRDGRVKVKTDVRPGQQVTFDFQNYPPMEPGNYNFQWRMLQSGVEWFGDKTPDITVGAGDAGATAIVSVRPLLVHAGGQIIIVGRNLTESVQFTDPSGQTRSATGSVSSNRREATVSVPGGTPSGVIVVKVSGNGLSNGRLIQVTNKPLPRNDPTDYGTALRNGEHLGAMYGACRDITWLDRNSSVALVNAKPGWSYNGLADIIWQGVRDNEAINLQFYCNRGGFNVTFFNSQNYDLNAHEERNPGFKESIIKAIEIYDALEMQRKGVSCIPDPSPSICRPFIKFMTFGKGDNSLIDGFVNTVINVNKNVGRSDNELQRMSKIIKKVISGSSILQERLQRNSY